MALRSKGTDIAGSVSVPTSGGGFANVKKASGCGSIEHDGRRVPLTAAGIKGALAGKSDAQRREAVASALRLSSEA
jgi:hypothetical protein